MRRRRPTPFEGAFVVPGHLRLVRIAWIEQSLQPATAAIFAVLSDLLSIMSLIISCCDTARLGAIVKL
jgi:hypothetical protein